MGKQITPISVTNSGGFIPARLYPQVAQLFSGNLYAVKHFIKSPSGDLFGIQDASIVRIRPDGNSTVLAGTITFGYVDGQGAAAQFNQMTDIISDNAGNLYVAESNSRDATNGRIRKITPGGVVTTYAQGLSSPNALAMDANGMIYVAEQTGRIMKVNTDGTVSFLAGQARASGKTNGTGAAATFNNVVALVVASDGNIYALESANNLIRKITQAGVVTTFAGKDFGNVDGNGTFASFYNPKMMKMDSKGNLIVADGNSLFRSVSPSADVVTILGPTYYDTNGQVKSQTYYDYFIIDEDDNVEYLVNGLYKILTTGFAITPTLPPGLTLSTNGTITGTPTAVSAAKNYRISAGNESGISNFELNLTVAVSTDPPVIASFSPTSAYTGQSITITGNHFTGTTAVTIGGKPVSYIFLASPTSINVTVPAGSSTTGDVTVTNPYGTANLTGFTLIQPPTITAVSPLSASAGSVVTITGTNFSGVGQVNFGGYNAAFTIISPTQINAIVGNSGASGSVTVSAPSGSTDFPGFTYIPGPNITAISSNSGGTGDNITITGSNFTNATDVSFGNISASSFTVISPTTINAIIAAGSGNGVSVTTPGGKATISNFTYILPPAITQISPLKGGLNSQITILGTNLSNSQVTIGGTRATIGYSSPNQILAYVGNGASSGDVVVTNSYGTASAPGFIWVPAPTISSFTPTTATTGNMITISGTELTEVRTVTIGGVNSSFNVISPTSLQVVVGTGASGALSVTSPGGTASLSGFIYSGPTISSFTPLNAGTGQTVVLTGSNFTNTSQVYFGGVPATSFIVNSPSQITAIVGSGKSGNVTLETPLGQASAPGFTHPAPSIAYISPTNAGPLMSTPVNIIGANFTNASAVSFGGVPATSFTVLSSTLISATPAAASASGDVVVVTPFGQDSRSGFVWVQPPTITTFSPAAQKSGGQITITGTNFIGITGVKIAGLSVSYSTISSTSIIVYINNGLMSGDINVSTIGGNASINGFIYSSPVIKSISPLIAASGQTVTISGDNFNGVQSVNFGGINAASFSIVSPNTITATVATGNSGLVNVTGAEGTASITGFTFLPPPVIYSFSPGAGGLGTTLTINGVNLLTTSSVTIGGTAATITSVSNTAVVVSVSSGASGKISLTTNAGTAVIDGFSWYDQPQITGISPLTANGLTPVTITGNNFTGIKEVKFGASTVDFTLVSPTQIKVTPVNSLSGIITVANPAGTASFPGFVFLPAPNITSFTKTVDGTTTEVNIIGTNFTNVTSVKFGSVEASSFIVNSPMNIKAIAGSGESGLITVTGDGGTGSIAGFLYNEPPAIRSFSQPSGPVGTTISISGDNFNTTPEKNIVYFGPVKAQVTGATKTRLDVVVPAGASGLVVTNIEKKLTGYANLPFLVTSPVTFSGYSNKLDINFSTSLTSLDIKDFDEDGNPDFLIATSDSLYILLHGSDKILSRSSFTKKVNLISGKQVTSTAVDDVDGDGKPDILLGTGLSIIFLRNTSSGGNVSFSSTAFETLDNSISGMFLRDIDMDGRPDLFIGTEGVFYQNTSEGSKVSFGKAEFFKDSSSSGSNISFTLTDIDGDNKPDPVFGSSYKGYTIFKNNSVPGSINPLLFPATYINESSFESRILESADFDGDGKVDLLQNNFSVISKVFLVSRNSSTNGSITTSSFQFNQDFLNTGLVSKNRLADIDGDGKVDLVGMAGSNISYSRNQSSVANIQFATPVQLTSGMTNSFNFQVGDVDGDGRNDIVALENVKSKVTIYHNGPIPTPQITSVFPLTAAKDSTVTISGKYFDQTSSVIFGTKPAKSFQVVSAQSITAIVGEGESGSITVKNPDGQNSFPGFTFIKLPVITSAITATDGSGELTLTGSNFTQTTKVSIAGVDAVSFLIKSDTEIIATFLSASGILSVTNTAGTSSFTGRVTLLSAPTITASGPLAFYPGDNVSLATSSHAGYTYQWLKDGVDISGATSGTYTASQSGAYTVTVTLDGVSKTSAPTVIKLLTLVPIPTITASGPLAFYPGDNVSLATSSQAGYTYQWLKDGVDISGATSGTYTASQSGAYTVTVTLDGVSKTSAPTVIKLLTFVPIPTITASGPLALYHGGSVLLTTNSEIGYSYQWFKDGVNIDGATAVSYTANQSGTYTVAVTLDGVSKTSATTIITSLFALPASNFTLTANSATCYGSANGMIKIDAVQHLNYTATITGGNLNAAYPFTSTTSIDNLSAGTYNVCFTVLGESGYLQCFTVVISEPKSLAVYAAVNNSVKSLNLTLEGSKTYYVTLNGTTTTTTSGNITLNLRNGVNDLTVATDKSCQGVYQNRFDISTGILAYPNPFTSTFNVNLGNTSLPIALIELFKMSGEKVYSKQFTNASGTVVIEPHNLMSGIYLLRVKTAQTEKILKVVKL